MKTFLSATVCLIAVLNFTSVQAQRDSERTTLINPPNSSVNLQVSANQIVDLTLQNNNILGVLVRVENSRSLTWNVSLFPFSSRERRYSTLAVVPVFWRWTISTVADAANVTIIAEWDRF